MCGYVGIDSDGPTVWDCVQVEGCAKLSFFVNPFLDNAAIGFVVVIIFAEMCSILVRDGFDEEED